MVEALVERRQERSPNYSLKGSNNLWRPAQGDTWNFSCACAPTRQMEDLPLEILLAIFEHFDEGGTAPEFQTLSR